MFKKTIYPCYEFRIETAIKSIIGIPDVEIEENDRVSIKEIDDWKKALIRENKNLPTYNGIVSAKANNPGVYKVKVRYNYKNYEVTIEIK